MHPGSSQEPHFTHGSFIIKKAASSLPLGMGLRCPASFLGSATEEQVACCSSLDQLFFPWLLYVQHFPRTKNDSFLDCHEYLE